MVVDGMIDNVHCSRFCRIAFKWRCWTDKYIRDKLSKKLLRLMVAGLRSISDSLDAFNFGIAGLSTLIGFVPATFLPGSCGFFLVERFFFLGDSIIPSSVGPLSPPSEDTGASTYGVSARSILVERSFMKDGGSGNAGADG